MFHKEGYKIILISTILLLIAILTTDKFIEMNWLRMVISSIFIIFYILVLQFFRNPKRNTIQNNDHIISPVDGKVVVIEEVFEPEFYKKKMIQVSIFMSSYRRIAPAYILQCSIAVLGYAAEVQYRTAATSGSVSNSPTVDSIQRYPRPLFVMR